MKTFVVATNIFTLLMYLVYALFGFPIKSDISKGRLFQIYKTLYVFEIIAAILVVCQIASGARRIELANR